MLDRDGVLNVDLGHVSSQSDTLWIPGAAQAVSRLSRSGFAVAIVTNQAGIAKGMYSEQSFREYMLWYGSALQVMGATIAGAYYCPHHPTEGRPPYLVDCQCRKPKPGLLLRAMADFGARPSDCVMIGDSLTDMSAAHAAGVAGHLFCGGNLEAFVSQVQTS
jgi:D-glycero-D-manno-heptose 1,7-bisphosphate phosphatase